MWNVIEGSDHVIAQFKTWQAAKDFADARMRSVSDEISVVFIA